MSPDQQLPDTLIVEQELWLSFTELCEACGGEAGLVELLVDEGVLVPSGAARESWRFGGASLSRARVAMRLLRDLEINAAGVALALDLLDEIAALRARLPNAG